MIFLTAIFLKSMISNARFEVKDRGLELQVIQECEECTDDAGSCVHEECKFVCCDEELKLKE